MDVKGSEYYNSISDRPLDLSGRFLRGVDSKGDREAGSYQEDALQQHGHDTKATTLGMGEIKIEEGYNKGKSMATRRVGGPSMQV